VSKVRIAAIVEGHGEIESVPLLLRRIAAEVDPALVVEVVGPIRIPADRLRKAGEMERAVEFAARRLGEGGGIFVLLDCDWEGSCPKTDAPALLARARTARSDLPVALVLAYKEFEAWFIAACESLRGKRGLANDMAPEPKPEEIRGAKEWLSRQMPPNMRYSESLDQVALTAVFDMQAAKRASSFDKCYREVVSLLSQLQTRIN